MYASSLIRKVHHDIYMVMSQHWEMLHLAPMIIASRPISGEMLRGGDIMMEVNLGYWRKTEERSHGTCPGGGGDEGGECFIWDVKSPSLHL